MRAFVLAFILATGTLNAQSTPAAPVNAASPAALTNAILGRWTGVLEYRDYSEPPTSTKRVQLPTWLAIRPSPGGFSSDYIYDDGPGKTVASHSTVVLDLQAKTYTVLATEGAADSYTIANLDQLKDGHGTLILTGPGKDDNKPAEIRTTWTVRRNLLSWLQEVRPAGSTDAFTFRHRYTFTRTDPPKVSVP